MLGKRDRFTLNSGQKEGAGTNWQCDEPMSQFRTQITLYFPGEPGKYEKFDNVREFTLGSEQRIHFRGRKECQHQPAIFSGTGVAEVNFEENQMAGATVARLLQI